MELQLKEPNITFKSFAKYVQENRYQMVPTDTKQCALEFLAVSNALGGEVGELQNIVKKIIREDVFLVESDLHDKFVLEAGDVMHYLISLIQLAGYNLEFILSCNVVKLDLRKQEHEKQSILPSTSIKS